MRWNKHQILLVTAAIGVTLDQWTKHLVHTKFFWGQSRPVIQDVFDLTYVRNSGAAFGLLHKAPAWFREPFFVLVPVVALGVIAFIFWKLKPHEKWTAWALSLILSGATGNLIDRLRFGFVIDFLDFHWKNVYHWPAFNVADSCIVVGVGILLLQSIFDKQSTL